MNNPRAKLFVLLCTALLLSQIAGCPVTPGDGTGDGDSNDVTSVTMDQTALEGLDVVITAIPVFYDASLEAGDDLIAFGTGNLTGVAYVVPSENPTAATEIQGNYDSAGFAIAGKKILLSDEDSDLVVFDTVTDTVAQFADGEFYLDRIPSDEGDDLFSPIRASGNLALIRNNANEVDDGMALKLVDVSAAVPTVTPLENPPVNVYQIWIDADEQVAVAQGGRSFFIYDLTSTATAPREIDLSNSDGIGQGTTFAYDNGRILYFAASNTDNVRLLNLTTETAAVLAEEPARRNPGVAMAGGKLAYFLDRDAYDAYSNTDPALPDVFAEIYRSAIGLPPATAITEGGIGGADPDTVDLPWFAYGSDLAIPPTGDWIFISGNEEVNRFVEYIQVSTGNQFAAWPLPGVDNFYIPGTDVTASASVVAFKTGDHEQTILAYIELP